MNKQSIEQFDIGIAPELYVAGHKDDGDIYTAARYVLVLEDSLGNRWRHPKHFNGCVPQEYDDEEGHGIWFEDTRVEAHAAAERLLARIRVAGQVDLDNWIESDPAYGSVAYQQYGEADQVARERAAG